MTDTEKFNAFGKCYTQFLEWAKAHEDLFDDPFYWSAIRPAISELEQEMKCVLDDYEMKAMEEYRKNYPVANPEE